MRKLLEIVLLAFLSGGSVFGKSWLAVSPDPALTEALAPLAAHRQSQGLEVTIADSSVEEAIVTLGAPPDYLLLVGGQDLIPSKTGRQYRWMSTQEESFAADPLFSDLDDDGMPEFPVGRIPATTPAQLRSVIAKIIAYEKRELGSADLSVPIWSGTPAYGKLLDETADWLLMTTVNKHLPDWAEPWLITANPNNTLNAWPEDQGSLFNRQIQRGAAFTAMIGHGNTNLFLSMEKPKEIVYTNDDTTGLENISPPLVIFACDCGNFAHLRHASLAATMLLKDGGPVATIAATTESHPLTNFYSSIGLMQAFAEHQIDRAGDLWFTAQTKAHQMRKPLIERLLKNVEGALEVEINIPKLKRDQLQMYAYLGDPAQRITLPSPLQATIDRSPAGSAWSWSATKPPAARRLLVQVRPESTPLRIKPPKSNRDQSLRLFHARNQQFAFQTIAEIDGSAEWSGEIETPGELRLVALSDGKIHVATMRLR